MTTPDFQRARSPEAKRAREGAILDAASRLATERGVREVTLTDIAAAVGMHKSAMLRYFETREEIYLRLAAADWVDWSKDVREELRQSARSGSDRAAVNAQIHLVARVLADSLVARPLFCDLLAHVPLNLERNVSLDAVRSFKLVALSESGAVADSLSQRLSLRPEQSRNVVATATAMAGALWQMAVPGPRLRHLYETDPDLSHALVDVAPRLTGILDGLLAGYAASCEGEIS